MEPQGDVFKKKKSASSTNKTAIVNLANDIHKKFHATCDVLEKIKPNVGRDGLIKLLNLKGVSEDKHSTNLREVDLIIGDGYIYSKIVNKDHSMLNFQRYEFAITGTQDYSGLHLSFSYEKKKREINIFDMPKLWGKMSNPANQEI